MTLTNQQILLVEDNLNLGFLLMEFLESEGFKVKWCRDGMSALFQLRNLSIDLCILDVMMPKLNGFQLADKVKEQQPDTPFLFLTARSMKKDRLRGYAVGAEDYLVKPIDEEELLCKIKVILRRRPSSQLQKDNLPSAFQIGQYEFNHERQELSFRGQTKRITEKESEVLKLLCQHQNKILRREDAVQSIYGKRDYFLGRSFDVFISRIRKLLSQDPAISIENVYKVGFILSVKKEGGEA